MHRCPHCLQCTRPGCTGCKADANSVAGQACTACDTKAGYSLSAQGGCVKQCEPGTYWSETQGAELPACRLARACSRKPLPLAAGACSAH